MQAEQAVYYGETPVNPKACPIMNKLSGARAPVPRERAAQVLQADHFWKTPVADCGNGKKDCMDYTKWQQAWTQIKG